MMITARLRREAATVGACLLAVVLFVFGVVHSSSFATSANIAQLLTFASFIGLAALGQTLVIIGGGIDLSIPWTMGLAGILLSHWTTSGLSPVLAIILLLVIGAAIGACNGIGVTIFGVSPIIMTLAVGGIVQGYLLYVGLGQASAAGAPAIATAIAGHKVAGIPILALGWIGCAIVISLILARTPFGRYLYAVGTNAEAARIAGVRLGRVRLLTYVASGVSATIAGIVLAGFIGQAYSDMGAPYLFGSIAAVALGGASILGGSGSYVGTIAGALTLTLLSALLPAFNLGESALRIVYGLVILLGVGFSRFAADLARRTPRVAAAPAAAPTSRTTSTDNEAGEK